MARSNGAFLATKAWVRCRHVLVFQRRLTLVMEQGEQPRRRGKRLVAQGVGAILLVELSPNDKPTHARLQLVRRDGVQEQVAHRPYSQNRQQSTLFNLFSASR